MCSDWYNNWVTRQHARCNNEKKIVTFCSEAFKNWEKKFLSYLLFWRHVESGTVIVLHVHHSSLNPHGPSQWNASTKISIAGVEVRTSFWCQNYRVLCINGRSTVQWLCSTTHLVLEPQKLFPCLWWEHEAFPVHSSAERNGWLTSSWEFG